MALRVKQHRDECLAERERRTKELERKFHEQDRGSEAARELKVIEVL